MSLNIGDTIDGKYRIIRLLGEGGMGAVYEGENLRIHRRVAIKILHSTVAASEDAVQRFEREAQAAGRIGSEHIVEVLDLGDLPGGDRYMVMEYLDGESLSDRIKNSGKLSCQITARLIVDALEGLKAAHAAGIVHRDLKPDNIFLLTNKNGKRDFVKIVDFGISKFSSLGGEFSMTRTGAVMGTPYYLSPEQAKGERRLDHRADLYAVGVILYEAAAGRVPFDGETFNELLFKIVLEPVPPLSTFVTPVDPHFQAIVEKAMARDANARFQSADDMQMALTGWLEGQPPAPELMATRGGDAAAAQRGPLGSEAGVAAPGAHAATQIGATNAAWANTNGHAASNHNAGKKWIYAAVAVALLAAAFGYFTLSSSSAAVEAASRAQTEAEQRADEEKKHEQELARLQADKARAEADRATAERARSEADRATADAELSTATKNEALQATTRAAAAAAAAAARPTTAHRPATAPSPSPAPRPTTSGRTIRTDL